MLYRQDGLPLGHAIEEHDLIGSTNDRALELASEGAPEGVVVTAREQIAGRGRTGRHWVSGRDRGLYVSVLLRPGLPHADLGFLSLAAGLAVLRVLGKQCGLEGTIKWPNDVLINGKKICGILIESRTGEAGVEAVVVGIGINTRWNPDDCAGDFRVRPTAINLEAGREPGRDVLLGSLLDELDRLYRMIREGGGEALSAAVTARLDRLGKPVTIQFPDRSVSGIIEGTGPSGGLVLRLPDGGRETFHSGELDYADRH